MNAPPLDQIIKAVLDWQHRQPLAERLGPEAVHSIGLVALPFLRASEEAAPPGNAWQALLQRLRGGGGGAGVAAFTERFIPGLAPQRAAAFALRHGADAVEGAEDWPQRRIEVDDAAAVSGGWPFERWLLSAAIDGRHGRQRVLIGLEPPLQVLGRRVLDRRRLLALGLLLLLPVIAGAWWLSRGEPPAPAPTLRVSGAVQAASAPASLPASAPALPPSAPEMAPSAPAIDIRPRLGPQRRSALPAAAAPSAPSAPGEAIANPPAASAPASGTGDPERVGPRLPSSGPVVALVSPVFAKREEAEAMLARMREHLAQTGGAALEGEVFEAKPGYRAAVWPFASREEAQLINATMIARGWKTRAVDF